MRHKATWVMLFFVGSSLLVAFVLNLGLADLFVALRVQDAAILGDRFRASTLIAVSIALLGGVYAGVINTRSRKYIEEVVVELDKVAWPTAAETRTNTFTVIVVSVIAAAIMGLFDTVFSWLALNYTLWLR
jgi:preprotein translocase subunit SecE